MTVKGNMQSAIAQRANKQKGITQGGIARRGNTKGKNAKFQKIALKKAKKKPKRHLAKGQKTSVGTELALSAGNSTP